MTDLRPRTLVLAALLAACAGGAPAPPADGDVAEPGPDDWFVDAAAAAGLGFSHFNGMAGDYWFPEMIPAGVALFDYDKDGDLDVYLVQSRMLAGRPVADAVPPLRGRVERPEDLRGRLYRNDLTSGAGGAAGLRFTDVTAQSGVDARDYGMAVATGDIDNDGWTDLYLSNYGANRLFRNRGDGTFEDVSTSSGTADTGWGVSASFVDYDADGWLDLYVGNYVHYDPAADRPCTGLTGRRDYCTPEVYPPQADRLFRNLGGGRFDDVTATALDGGPFGPALGVSTADFNGDGWIDLYVANDGRENLLWLNRGDGTLENRGLLSGAALSGDGRPEASMGVDAGDYDNDGDEDLFVTHLPTEGNNLYVNSGDALFEDESASSGLGPGSLGFSGFGAAWIDYDNDGWLDLVAVNGSIEAQRQRLDATFPYDERNLLFRNMGDGRFEDVTASAGTAFARSEVSRGAAVGDVDNDGDVDILIANLNGPVRLLLNRIGNRHHWIGLSVVGAGGRPALGARIDVDRAGREPIRRRVRADGSYASANDPRVIVGLGADATPPRVRVRWPGRGVDQWHAVPIDRWTTLEEGEGDPP